MSARVRLLPVLIGAAGVLMALRLGAMASSESPGGQADSHLATSPAETPHAAKAEHAGRADEKSTPSPAPKADPADGSGIPAETKGEAEVLQDLSTRRAALDARERELGLREQLLSATEGQVQAKLEELKALEQRLNAALAQREAAETAQIASLVKSYENMKPADAAKIFNKLDRQVLLEVASRMKPAKIGAVLAAMEAARAQELTVLLANRMKVARPPAAVPAAQGAAAPEPEAPSAPAAG